MISMRMGAHGILKMVTKTSKTTNFQVHFFYNVFNKPTHHRHYNFCLLLSFLQWVKLSQQNNQT